MKPQLWIMVAVSVVTLFNTVSGFILSTEKCVAPSPCTCSSSNVVYCQGKSLTDVPRFIPTNSTEHVSPFYVYLYSNRLTTVPDNSFKNLSSINTTQLYIEIYNNKISSIGQNAFASVENKTYRIDLSNNNLTSLPTSLSRINSLRYLDITGNPLKSLDPSVTSHLSYLLYDFRFDMGAFQSWPYELRYFKHLKSLTINQIPFSHLTLNAFDGLESGLTSLTIANSQLPRIPSAVCHFRNLNTLGFTDNTMLDSNSTLFEPCQHKLNHLMTLNLQNNGLNSIPDVLHSFQALTTLKLDNNQIRFIHTNTIPFNNKITSLNLNNNRFTHIPFAVNKMKALQYLYLGSNEIVTVEDHDLISLVNLNWLGLFGNPVEYIAPRAFKNNGLLNYITLHSTKLTTLPEAILSLHKLIYITFTGNHVKCECDMSYLKGWNATKLSTFTGNCENQPSVTIKQYILTSLQDCP